MQVELNQLVRIARALARPLLLVGPLSLLPFGIIPAALLVVRWLFVPRAVLIDGVSPAEARA